MTTHTTSRRRLLGCLGACGASPLIAPLAALLGAGTVASAAQAQSEESALARIRRLGRLSVGVYHDLPPFHVKGEGIEVHLAAALARHLGVSLSLLPFNADENMNDDLRNMVWRGHYLGYGPADVLLHVPVDRPLMETNPRVSIFAPYWRERVVIARDLSKVPDLEGLEPLVGRPVAVAGMSLAGWLMIGAESGRLREHLTTKLANGVEAAGLLKEGRVVAAAGARSELESALRGDTRFAITPLPVPRAPRDGWAVGMAVKKESSELAEALAAAVNEFGRNGELERIFATGGLRWQRV